MDTLRWILLIIGILVLAGIYVFGTRFEWRRRWRDRGGEPRGEPHFDDGPESADWDEDDVLVAPRRRAGAAEDEWVDDVRPVRREPADEVELPAADAGREAPAAPPSPPAHEWADDVRPVQPAAAPAPEPAVPDAPPADDEEWVDDVRPIRRTPAEAETVRQQRQVDPEPGEPEELLIIHVVAEPAGNVFKGEAIETAFAACDLSFGAMHIYHREAGVGEPMFSVINMLKPGTFEPAKLAELETPGLSLFMQLPGPDQPMVAFRAMSDCARRLAQNLGGRLQDESRSAMTAQTLSHYEERVRSFIQHHARSGGGRRV